MQTKPKKCSIIIKDYMSLKEKSTIDKYKNGEEMLWKQIIQKTTI